MASEPYGKVHAFGGEREVGDFEWALLEREWARGRKRREEKRKALLDQWEREEPKRKKHLDKLEELRRRMRNQGKKLAPPKKKRRVPINPGDAFRH